MFIVNPSEPSPPKKQKDFGSISAREEFNSPLPEKKQEKQQLVSKPVRNPALEETKLDTSQMALKVFGEDSKSKTERIRRNSPYQHLKSWRLLNLIIKAGDDLKQEQFAMQLISTFAQIFKSERLKLLVRPYEVISLGPSYGVLEMITDAITIDRLKQNIYSNYDGVSTLADFFKVFYPASMLKKAREKFCLSLAAYSVITYFLQIKDRHNGNILLHRDGYIVHIDFGFFLSHAPGNRLSCA